MRHFSALLALAALLAAPLSSAQELEVLPEDRAEGSDDDTDGPAPDKGSDADAAEQDDPSSDAGDEEEASDIDADDLGGAFQLGLRLGFAFPSGEATEGAGSETNRMSDAYSGQVPLWLDVGYRINSHWVVGVWGLYGFTFVKEVDPDGSGVCPTDGDCSAGDIRFGLEAAYHINPLGSWDPWVGVGFGYEILSTEMSGGGSTVKTTLSGFEPINFQVGLDAPSEDGKQALGVFLAYSVGQFSQGTVDINGQETSEDITRTASHSWITLGFRGTADF